MFKWIAAHKTEKDYAVEWIMLKLGHSTMSYIIIDLLNDRTDIHLLVHLSRVARIILRQDNSTYKKKGQTSIVKIVRW